MQNAVLFHEILCIKNVWLIISALELCHEFIEGSVLLIAGRLYLDGRNLPLLRDEKVDLHMILTTVCIAFGIKI